MRTGHDEDEEQGELEVAFTLPTSNGACVSVAAANGIVELTTVTRDGQRQRVYLDVPTLYAVMDRLDREWYGTEAEDGTR